MHDGMPDEKVLVLLGRVDSAELLAVLLAACPMPIMVLDDQHRIVTASSHYDNGFGDNGLRQRHLSDVLPPSVREERVTIVRAVTASRERLRVRGMLFGVWTESRYLPVEDCGPGGSTLLVVVCRPLSECGGPLNPSPRAAEDSERRIEATQDDLGQLSVLSEREAQVLRMIGLGYQTTEIAEELHRAPKTIEGHRATLGGKLRAESRVDLARIAVQSGLTLLEDEEIRAIWRRAKSGEHDADDAR